MPKPQWHWQIKAAGKAEAEVYIYGDIGDSWDEESVTAKRFADELAGVDADYLSVRINSHGGAVSDGLAIYNAIRRHPAVVTTEIDGVAMSAASLIAMAGDTVRMADNALLMIHAPWTIALGNAGAMRKSADTLDKYAEAMASAYVRNSVSYDDALALLQDGDDHYYTASEAQSAGFVDEITDAMPIAASAKFDLSRYPGLPAAAAAFTKPEKSTMSVQTPKPAATDPKPADTDNVAEIQAAAEKRKADAIRARNEQITAAYSRHMKLDGVPELMAKQMADPDTTLEQAQAALLGHIGAGAEPHGSVTRVESMMDERDKFRAGARAVVLARMGVEKDDRSNQFRGQSLAQIAAHALTLAGISSSGLTKKEIAGKVLAMHTTSDFPNLMLDAANKRLQAAYEAFPSTYEMWANIGEVSDFKTVNMIRMGAFNSLDTIPEGEEYTQGTVGEEKETLTAATKGKYISLTRQMIINDDLQGFSRMAQLLGRAAARTVNADAYGILNTNGNMSDGTALFHADHGNLAGSGGAISVATLGAGRSAMRKQTAPGSNATEYLNIMPRYLIVPVVKEDLAREVVTSEYNTDTAASRKRNPITSWGPLDIVSDPVLDATSTTAWYMAADPMDAPLVEVHFLDGQQSPYIDDDMDWLTDAVRWKVRLDYGVSANDYRGGYKNAGA